jgi:hypothetical protein
MPDETDTWSDLRAVATGDIVGFSEMSRDRRRGMSDRLKSAYNGVRRVVGDELPCDLAISSGDRWQVYAERPAIALAVLIAVLADLRAHGIDSRVVLAVDRIDYIEDQNLHESDGAAFRRSGRTIEKMERARRVRCLAPESAETLAQVAMGAVSETIDLIVQSWTEAQARAVVGKSVELYSDQRVTNAAIGESWTPESITKQAVGDHLRKAQWPRIQRTVRRFETIVGELSDHA